MDIIIIKLLFNYNIYIRYYNEIDIEFIRSNSKQLEKLLLVIEKFHEKYPEKSIQSVDELEVFYFSQYPAANQKDRDTLEPIFRRLQNTTVTEEVAEEFFEEQKKKSKAARFALHAIQVSEGQRDWESLVSEIATLGNSEAVSTEDEFVVDYSEDGRPPQGIRWPWKTMNTMMGSLRKGNFGFIFARPETGKTTFLAHFSTHALKQLSEESGPGMWFNNEQPGIEVLHRCMQSYFGITSKEFYENKVAFRDRYYLETKGKLKIVDDANISKGMVEKICRKYKPAFIIFDQIDKIRGFNSDRKDLEYKEIYQWARELSKEYGPVIGVCQAGGSAEGKKWLTMEDVDSSKTAKQGEADWILGIGKSHQEGMDSVRHFHLCKNKLLGDEDTDPSQRHGKANVLIKADIGRYEDIEK